MLFGLISRKKIPQNFFIVRGVNLTGEEIRASSRDTYSINPIVVVFSSQAGLSYEINYHYELKNLPYRRRDYVVLWGKDRDEEDFLGVERIIAAEFGGRVEPMNILDYGEGSISRGLNLRKHIDPLDFYERCRNHFPGARIKEVYFGVRSGLGTDDGRFHYAMNLAAYEKFLRDSGFPLEKIIAD